MNNQLCEILLLAKEITEKTGYDAMLTYFGGSKRIQVSLFEKGGDGSTIADGTADIYRDEDVKALVRNLKEIAESGEIPSRCKTQNWHCEYCLDDWHFDELGVKRCET